MGFSGAVVLSDLDDFINPSQACIKPVEVQKNGSNQSKDIRVDAGNYYEVSHDGNETKLDTASISLDDCLACSGCITSAESVLITLQSQRDLYDVLAANKAAVQTNQPQDVKTVIVSVSPQSRASLAAKYDLTPIEVHRRLLWFFKQFLGVHDVFDTAFSRDFALLESAKEFVRRYSAKYSVQPGVGQISTNTSGPLPMLASACPGWICYAEKTHDHLLPYIDSTKSPQQIMGSLVKNYLGDHLGVPPNRIYHITVMPCYDKKLEASRQDFFNTDFDTRDVDTVITTGEVEKMFTEQNVTLTNMEEVPINSLFTKAIAGSENIIDSALSIPLLVGTEGSSSGGYLSYILRYAAYTLFGIVLTMEDVEMGKNGVEVRPGRNSDYTEYLFHLPPDHPRRPSHLPADPAVPVLRFVAAYGFRNVQNLVRKLNPKSSATVRRRNAASSSAGNEYHYVEVMACPSGCINGGGQLKPANAETATLTDSKAWIQKAEDSYKSVAESAGVQFPEANAAIELLYQEWLGGSDTSKAKEMLHTSYRGLEKANVSGLSVKW
ncbi:iron hydrogenase [Phlyctochytrium arcticum]|nr:iron hydrogenase [Phlyctochytrium arcticum]